MAWPKAALADVKRVRSSFRFLKTDKDHANSGEVRAVSSNVTRISFVSDADTSCTKVLLDTLPLVDVPSSRELDVAYFIKLADIYM